MPTVTMSMEEYLALIQGVEMMSTSSTPDSGSSSPELQPKRRTRSSKYGKVYKREFRKIAPKYKMKNGKWKKDGFKSAVKAAHRATKKLLG